MYVTTRLHAKSLETIPAVRERGSSLKTEFVAGFICFIANAYQLVLVPEIQSDIGLKKDTYLFAFCASTTLSSLLVGLFSNLPLPAGELPPDSNLTAAYGSNAGVGIGCATFVSFSLAERSGYDKDEAHKRQVFASTICFVSSAVMTAAAGTGIQWQLFRKIPFCVRSQRYLII